MTVPLLLRMKEAREPIVALTAYDYSFGRLLDEAGVDVVLVGDSLGMVVQGHDATLPVTLADMIYHTACVRRGVKRALLVADMPFASYQVSPQDAYVSAARLLAEGRADMVKLEGGAFLAQTVRFLVERGIPVCAHVGLMPQYVRLLGGYRVQGRGEDASARVRADGEALAAAGASLIVLEAVPAPLAASVTAALAIPTLGIGAGVDCDGQVLVLTDALGLSFEVRPRFVQDFLAVGGSLKGAIEAYVAAVRARRFPGPEHMFGP